jgi:hypothetical protein
VKLLQRRRVFVDMALQGRLCIRVAIYWLGCLLSVALILGWWSALDKNPASVFTWLQEVWQQYGPVFVLSLLALPLALLDCLIMSNRYAGPILRMRRAMNQLARSEAVAPLRLRRGDLLHEMADDLNRIAALVEKSVSGGSDETPDENAPGQCDGVESKSNVITSTGSGISIAG